MANIPTDDVPKCQSCKKAPAVEEHPCPFRSEINDDETTLCNCCADCRQECAYDV